MDTSSTASAVTLGPRSVNARAILLPYALSLIGAMVLVQLVIAASGSRITGPIAGLTALVALGTLVWLWSVRGRLAHVRFGAAVAHAIAYVTVTTSFTAHACVRLLMLAAEPEGLDAASRFLLESPWFGATLVMSAVWGVGLLVHLLGAVLGRGWERGA